MLGYSPCWKHITQILSLKPYKVEETDLREELEPGFDLGLYKTNIHAHLVLCSECL